MKINLNLNLEPNDSLSSAIKYKKKGVVAKALLEPFHPAQRVKNTIFNINNFKNQDIFQNSVLKNIENIIFNNNKNFENISNTDINENITQNTFKNIFENLSKNEISKNYYQNKTDNINSYDFASSVINNKQDIIQNETQNILKSYKNFQNKNIHSSENISKNIFQKIGNNSSNAFNFAKNSSSIFKNIDFGNDLSHLERGIGNKENQTSFNNNINKNNTFGIIDFPQHLPQHLPPQHFYKNFTENTTENIFPINYSPTINIHTNDINSFDFAGELENHSKILGKILNSAIHKTGGRDYVE